MVELLAHQGGWDEALFVLVPMVVFAALLWIAKRRAEEETDEDREGGQEPTTGEP